MCFYGFSLSIMYDEKGMESEHSGEKNNFMSKKNKKEKKKQICIDCKEETSDYYKVPTNRGNIIKCAKCYELWIWRSTRLNWNFGGNSGKTNHYDD